MGLEAGSGQRSRGHLWGGGSQQGRSRAPGPTASLLSSPLVVAKFFSRGVPRPDSPGAVLRDPRSGSSPSQALSPALPGTGEGLALPAQRDPSVCLSVRCALFSPSWPLRVPSPRVSLPVQPQLGPFPSLLSVLIRLFTAWVLVLSICCRFYQPCKAFFRPMSCGHRFLRVRLTKSCSFRAVAHTGCFAEHP